MTEQKKLVLKEKKIVNWETAVNALLNSTLDVNYFSKDGEIYISINDESLFSIALKKDGTWSLQ